jgi:HAD superfamily hydrolase (TIGR01509 family)
MAELEALLFDVDGTLADTERDGHRVAFNRAFEEAGLDWHWSEEVYGRLLAVTGGKERIRHYLATMRPDFALPADGDAFIAGLHAAKTRFYTEMLADGAIPLRPGVERLLSEARSAGLRLAVATTTTPENVTALLVNTLGEAAIGWFEVIAAGDIVPAKKPAPDIYIYAMERLGVKPEQCMAFEDSHNGVRAVLDAGIHTLLVTTNGYTADDDLNGASVVLDQLGEPGAPCVARFGPTPADGVVDLAYLRELHRTALEPAA